MPKRKKPLAETKNEVPPVDPKIEIIAQVDSAVREIELKYGAGRLLAACADLELAAKMRRQMVLYNQAIWQGGEGDARVQGQGLLKGYEALERHYLANGGEPLNHAAVIEADLGDGSVLAIVPAIEHFSPKPGDGRDVLAIGADTVAEMFDEKTRETLGQMAKHFPGAKIEAVRDKRPVGDDEIPF